MPFSVSAGTCNALTDVEGVLVGHDQRIKTGWATGTTVVVPPAGTIGSVDVRGGGPATRETDALAPDSMIQFIDAVCLSGGSVHGLSVPTGVFEWLEPQGRGFRVGPEPHQVVPIVPAAAIFDLGSIGSFENRPDAGFGRRAAMAAADGPVAQGSVGVGAGATAGVLRGGVGTASAVLASGATVGAVVVVNAAGSPVDPATGQLWGARYGVTGEFDDLLTPSAADVTAYRERLYDAAARRAAAFNTTLAVVATDAELTKPECRRLAGAGHDGMARALDPIHAYVDGDICFGLATGAVPLGAPNDPLRPEGKRLLGLSELLAAASGVVCRAIVHGVLAATDDPTYPNYRTAFPSAFA